MNEDLINLDLSKENKEKVDSLSSLLTPGLPLMVTNRVLHEFSFTRCSSELFFSDGTVNDNKLGVQKARNIVYASLVYKGSRYGVDGELTGEFSIHSLPSEHSFIEFSKSFFNQEHYFNEGTFTGVPVEGVITHSGGSDVVRADEVKFKDALTALRFASEAIHFSLPYFYYSGKDSVLKAVEGLFCKAVCESGINSLLHHDNTSCLSGNKLVNECFEHELVGTEPPKWWGSYNLLPTDYVLRSDACYAFIKVENNNAYVVPVKEQLGGQLCLLFELALLPDFIKKFFPEGF